MAPQRDNMLEAFRKISREDGPAKAAAPAEPAPRARARSKRNPRAEKATDSRGSRGSKGALAALAASLGPLKKGPVPLPLVLLAALFLGLAFGAGVLVGRGSGGGELEADLASSQADGLRSDVDWEDDWRVATPDELAPAGLVAGAGGAVPAEAAAPTTPEPEVPVSALMDPVNEYTIVVVTYGSSAEGERHAFAARDHLERAGLPVEEPYQVGEHIVVFVGAAPRSEDLAELEARVRSLALDGKPAVYGDAFRVRIDRYVSR